MTSIQFIQKGSNTDTLKKCIRTKIQHLLLGKINLSGKLNMLSRDLIAFIYSYFSIFCILQTPIFSQVSKEMQRIINNSVYRIISTPYSIEKYSQLAKLNQNYILSNSNWKIKILHNYLEKQIVKQ
jgi:hypothetical protein